MPGAERERRHGLIVMLRSLAFLLVSFGCSASMFAHADAFISPCGGGTCTIYKVDLATSQLDLMDRDEDGTRFGNAKELEEWGTRRGRTLRFATNAGIFSWTFNPLGLFVTNGKERVPLNSQEGSGNFYMKPNGVFYLQDKRAHIVQTSDYKPTGRVELASQSGPLLLMNGNLHPSFRKDSENKVIRSGVGLSDGGQVYFAISNENISFWDFASLFKDKLGCTDALYLDGLISKMYVPDLRRNQKGGNFAALFAVFEEQHNKSVDTTAHSASP